MHRKIQFSIPQIFIFAILIILTTTITVLAATGTTEALNAPGLTSSYTLEDIYQRLNSGTVGSQSTFTEPAVDPGTGSMHDLNDIMAAAPEAVTTNGATADQVLDGQSFWGLTNGQWGLQTGNILSGSNVTGADGDITFAIPDGYYNGNFATAVDNDLQPENILDGVSIFNVTGNIPSGSNVTGADGAITFVIPNGYYAGRTATATDSDLLAGNILNGVEIFGVTGNIPTGSNVSGANGLITFDIPDGYYVGRTATASDSDLLAENIMIGENIFGVEGERYGGCVCNGHMVGNTGTRWCDNEDGTITDMIGYNGSGACLIWLQNANCFGQAIWIDAISQAGGLRSGQCGLNDGSFFIEWRLPTEMEMRMLTKGTDPVLSSSMQGFTNVQGNWYWSSSTSTTFTNAAYVENLASGVYESTSKNDSLYFWAVRNE